MSQAPRPSPPPGSPPRKLWEQRTGRKQKVAVDVRQATASMRSGTYMKLGDGALSHARNSIMGTYPTKDGRWSYLHCNFPNHRAVALKVLGVAEEDRAAVAKAVSTWNAIDLEEAIIANKGAGGMVRSAEEWKTHPQAAAIASLPLLEIEKIGDAPVSPLPKGDRPLSGIKVVDITRVLAGPTCARTLAEHGADVMKITAAHLPNLGYQEWDTGHGKLSAQLDLRDPAAAREAARLDQPGRRLLAGLPAGHARLARPLARGARQAAAGPGLCLAVGVRT